MHLLLFLVSQGDAGVVVPHLCRKALLDGHYHSAQGGEGEYFAHGRKDRSVDDAHRRHNESGGDEHYREPREDPEPGIAYRCFLDDRTHCVTLWNYIYTCAAIACLTVTSNSASVPGMVSSTVATRGLSPSAS